MSKRKRNEAPVVETVQTAKKPKINGEICCAQVIGDNDVGQLGLGPDVIERKKPAMVPIDENVASVAAGGMHCVVVTQSNRVYSFGCNDELALGRVTKEDDEAMVPGLIPSDLTIVQVSTGDSHTVFRDENGKVYVCGSFRDAQGSLGLTPTLQRSAELVPLEIPESVTKICSGTDHVACLTKSGQIHTFGNGENGQLGRIPAQFAQRGGRRGLALILNPAPVHTRKRKTYFSDVWTGQYSTYALDNLNRIYCWGLNNHCQLGFSDKECRFTPTVSLAFQPGRWRQICGGMHHALAIDENFKAFAIGRASYGRLGVGPREDGSAELLPIKAFDGVKIKSVSAGGTTSFAADGNGQAYAWGMSCCQIGQEDEDQWEPALLSGKNLAGRKVLYVSTGGQQTILLVSNPL